MLPIGIICDQITNTYNTIDFITYPDNLDTIVCTTLRKKHILTGI